MTKKTHAPYIMRLCEHVVMHTKRCLYQQHLFVSNSGILNELKIDTHSPWRVSADLSESRNALTFIFLMKSRQHLHFYGRVSEV